MGVKVTSPSSDAVVDLAEELVDAYEAQGWTRVVEPKSTSKK